MLGRLCPRVLKSTGLLSSHQHCQGWGGHSFSSTTSAHPPVHRFPHQEQQPGSPAGRGCPAGQGGHREGQQRDFSRVLQPAVPGAEKDRSPSSSNRLVHTAPAHGGAPLQDGNSGILRIRHQLARSQEWTASIDIRDAYLHVPMHKAVRKYLRFAVNKRVYEFTCLPFGLATLPQEFTKLQHPIIALLRKRGVKLHVSLDNWLIHADTPEQAQLHVHCAPVSRLDH